MNLVQNLDGVKKIQTHLAGNQKAHEWYQQLSEKIADDYKQKCTNKKFI
jgi:hypothetical protein